MIRAHYASKPHAFYAALDVLVAEPERCVVLRNLPAHTTPDKLEKKLRRSYSLVGEPGVPSPLARGQLLPLAGNGFRLPSELLVPKGLPVPQSVLKLPSLYVHDLRRHAAGTDACFLVRLQNTVEAMRLIRSWHRTRYIPQKYPVENVGDRFVVDAELVY